MQIAIAIALILGALPSLADEFFIAGQCVATGIDSRGVWTYQLTMTWNTDTQGVSHLDVLLDDSGNCTLDDFERGLILPDPGDGSGAHECMVWFDAKIDVKDPSVGLNAILLKFEPHSNGDCEPGSTGSAVFNFESSFAPAPIAADNLFVIEKSGHNWSRGELTGVFPGLPCDPVADDVVTWSSLKASYR